MGTSKKLTIFEGCDGSGKSTAAAKFAEATGAKYVHFGPFPRVTTGLPRIFLEAMLPALLGYQDVVFDRCWLSEPCYAHAFRGGKTRIMPADARMLERVALRCGATVIMCDPGWEAVLYSYRRRKGDEYLETEDQLRHVYEMYKLTKTDLPLTEYDYTAQGDLIPEYQDNLRVLQHDLAFRSAGSLAARVAIVGSDFGSVKDQDPFLQHPFVSFSGSGCSQWLTSQLTVSESSLFWVNADDPGIGVLAEGWPNIVSLGVVAAEALARRGMDSVIIPHPSSWKRFSHSEPYPLNDIITGLVK